MECNATYDHGWLPHICIRARLDIIMSRLAAIALSHCHSETSSVLHPKGFSEHESRDGESGTRKHRSAIRSVVFYCYSRLILL